MLTMQVMWLLCGPLYLHFCLLPTLQLITATAVYCWQKEKWSCWLDCVLCPRTSWKQSNIHVSHEAMFPIDDRRWNVSVKSPSIATCKYVYDRGITIKHCWFTYQWLCQIVNIAGAWYLVHRNPAFAVSAAASQEILLLYFETSCRTLVFLHICVLICLLLLSLCLSLQYNGEI